MQPRRDLITLALPWEQENRLFSGSLLVHLHKQRSTRVVCPSGRYAQSCVRLQNSRSLSPRVQVLAHAPSQQVPAFCFAQVPPLSPQKSSPPTTDYGRNISRRWKRQKIIIWTNKWRFAECGLHYRGTPSKLTAVTLVDDKEIFLFGGKDGTVLSKRTDDDSRNAACTVVVHRPTPLTAVTAPIASPCPVDAMKDKCKEG